MSIVLLGSTGLLGRSFARLLGGRVLSLSRSDLDLVDEKSLYQSLKLLSPKVVINCSAYTNVDRAESEIHEAYEINTHVPAVLARIARELEFKLVHFSTDYVFSSLEGLRKEEDNRDPLNIYGRSKFQGERCIEESGCDHLILRVSWLYGFGGPSFVHKMIDLSKNRNEIQIVSDQRGCPTFCDDVVEMTDYLIEAKVRGIFHCVGEGTASWFDFASCIFEILNMSTKAIPCNSDDFPTIAERPKNSALDNCRLHKIGKKMPLWKDSLGKFLSHYPQI